MTIKSERRKQKKRRREAKKAARRNEYNQQARTIAKRLSKYPEIIFDEAEGTSEFVDVVRKAQSEIDFDDPAVCPEHWRDDYKVIRVGGYKALIDQRKRAVAQGLLTEQEMELDSYFFMLHYGTQLFNRIPLETRQRLLPYNELYVRPDGNRLLLSFSSLLQTRGDCGTIYYSRRRPTITISGRTWPVGFSRHSIEQAVLRMNPNYCDYSCSSDVHAFFAQCVYFEPAQLDSVAHPKQPAFSMFDTCDDPGYRAYEVYVKDVLGAAGNEPDRTNGKFYFRLGYFPYQIDRGFAKAVSFIRPGYTGTPELKALRESKELSKSRKAFLLAEARENKGRQVLLEGRSDVIKWFHEHAVPQVKQIAEVVFDHTATERPVFVRGASLKEIMKRYIGREDRQA